MQPATANKQVAPSRVDKQPVLADDKLAAAKPAPPAPAEAETKEKPVSAPVTAEELKYAGQLQRQATIYGHYPTSTELNPIIAFIKGCRKMMGTPQLLSTRTCIGLLIFCRKQSRATSLHLRS